MIICPYCNGHIPHPTTADAALTELPAPPPGKYKSTDHYIELRQKDLLLHKKILGEVIEHTIPYGDIVAVVLRPAKRFRLGWLILRDRKNRYLPLPTNFRASTDELSICIGYCDNDQFTELYHLLKPFADRNATPHQPAPAQNEPEATLCAGLSIPTVGEPQTILEQYFRNYYPDRANAAMALQRNTGLSLLESRALIDYYFEENSHRHTLQ